MGWMIAFLEATSAYRHARRYAACSATICNNVRCPNKATFSMVIVFGNWKHYGKRGALVFVLEENFVENYGQIEPMTFRWPPHDLEPLPCLLIDATITPLAHPEKSQKPKHIKSHRQRMRGMTSFSIILPKAKTWQIILHYFNTQN